MQNNYEEISEACINLLRYIEKENFQGYDPYDGLTSPIFKLPFIKSSKKIKFLGQQFLKRLPINIRPIIGIKKRINPVTLGLCIHGYANLLNDSNKIELTSKINNLISQLESLIPNGFKGACWGYDFPWESRYATIPAYQPTVVATGIITNGLYKAYLKTNDKKISNLIIRSCDFVLNDLNKSIEKDGTFCFSYSPFDNEKVFNASLKGARILAQGYSITKNELWKQTAKNAIEYVIRYQGNNGSWIYSQSNSGKWIDNYHTGYVLDCIAEYQLLCNDYTFNTNLLKGTLYYTESFFKENGQPKFYNEESLPVDCTAAAQSILTLSRNNDLNLANKVAIWTINNMQDNEGYFYFRRYKYTIDKTSFMRWSNAWMFAGLTEYLSLFPNNQK